MHVLSLRLPLEFLLPWVWFQHDMVHLKGWDITYLLASLSLKSSGINLPSVLMATPVCHYIINVYSTYKYVISPVSAYLCRTHNATGLD